MNILVTGSEGFIAKNIIVHLQQLENVIIYKLNKSTTKKIEEYVGLSEIIIHCAGVNRPKNPIDFKIGNTDLTYYICNLLKKER